MMIALALVNFWPDEQDGKLRAARFFTSDRQLAGQKSSKNERQYRFFSGQGDGEAWEV